MENTVAVQAAIGCRSAKDSRSFKDWKPIGFINTCFITKNATPRQGSITAFSRGILKISKDFFTSPNHSLEGLQEFSHIWLIFVFDRNGHNCVKAKVAPPRLDGKRVGVFSTRSPHRPNPIGLTLAKLEEIKGDTLYLSGLDLVNDTCILDIKPYIPQYDSPIPESERWTSTLIEHYRRMVPRIVAKCKNELLLNGIEKESQFSVVLESTLYKLLQEMHTSENQRQLSVQTPEMAPLPKQTPEPGIPLYEFAECEKHSDVRIPCWLSDSSKTVLQVTFHPRTEQQIKQFSLTPLDVLYKLQFLHSSRELRSAITSVLSEDPRSTYRRNKCKDQLYYFTVDTAHITAWFFDETAEVLFVKPNLECNVLQ